MRLSGVALLTGILFAPVMGQPPKAANDQAAIQGKWSITKVEFPDDPDLKKGEAEANELARKIEFTVKENRITATAPGKAEALELTFTYDAAKTPKQVDFTLTEKGAPDGEKVLGIYKLEGDTAVIAVAVGEKIARPATFKPSGTKKDKGGVLVIHLKRVK